MVFPKFIKKQPQSPPAKYWSDLRNEAPWNTLLEGEHWRGPTDGMQKNVRREPGTGLLVQNRKTKDGAKVVPSKYYHVSENKYFNWSEEKVVRTWRAGQANTTVPYLGQYDDAETAAKAVLCWYEAWWRCKDGQPVDPVPDPGPVKKLEKLTVEDKSCLVTVTATFEVPYDARRFNKPTGHMYVRCDEQGPNTLLIKPKDVWEEFPGRPVWKVVTRDAGDDDEEAKSSGRAKKV